MRTKIRAAQSSRSRKVKVEVETVTSSPSRLVL